MTPETAKLLLSAIRKQSVGPLDHPHTLIWILKKRRARWTVPQTGARVADNKL